LNSPSPTGVQAWSTTFYYVAAHVIGLIRMAAVIRRMLENRLDEDRLKDVDDAMEQKELGRGKQIISDKELDAFIDRCVIIQSAVIS